MPFQQIFEILPHNLLLLSPQFIIQAASDAYLEATLTDREAIVGRYVFEVFPDNPLAEQANAVHNLKVSLERVLETKKPHQMSVQHYDVPDPKAPGQFVERYWSPLNTPVLDEKGEVTCVVHQVTNVTERIKTQRLLSQSQANEALGWVEAQRQRDQLRRLLMQAPAVICIHSGPELVYELVNPGYQALFPGRELLGKPLHEALPELVDQPLWQIIQRVYTTGETYQGHELLAPIAPYSGGPLEDRYWNFTYQARRNEKGEVDGMLVFCYDVTAQVLSRKRVEESERALQAVNQQLAVVNEELTAGNQEIAAANEELQAANEELRTATEELSAANEEIRERNQELAYQHLLIRTITDNATSCLLMMDKQGYCTFINPAGEKMLGYSFEEIRQKPLHYMIHHHRPDGSFYPLEECPIDRALPENFDIRAHQDVFFRKDGSSFLVSCAASPIFEGGVPVSTVIEVRDISEEKRAQTALLHMNQVLSCKNKDLEQVNAQLDRTNKDLDNFVYTASHDLKAPILNVEGLLKALERQLSRQTRQDETVEQIYKLLYSSVSRFKNTILDLTEVARISKESPEDLATIALGEVLGEVLEDLEPQIQQARAQVEVRLNGQEIPFSRKNLKSILYNLVSNAVKYRSPERELLVQITCLTQGDYHVLQVEDNGLGMDMRQEEKIFALFKRLHTHVEGTGIGLYIVKKIVENAGGKIEVKSQVGVGSTFRVYFKH